MKRNANLSDGCIHGEIFSKSHQIKPKSDWIYHFLIDLDPIGRPFGSKINRKMVNTIWFQVDLIRLRKNFSVCARDKIVALHRMVTFWRSQFRKSFACVKVSTQRRHFKFRLGVGGNWPLPSNLKSLWNRFSYASKDIPVNTFIIKKCKVWRDLTIDQKGVTSHGEGTVYVTRKCIEFTSIYAINRVVGTQ